MLRINKLYSLGLGVIYPFLPLESTNAQFNNLPRAPQVVSNSTDDYSKKSLEELVLEQNKLLDSVLEVSELEPLIKVRDVFFELNEFYKKISHEEEYFDLRSKLVLDGKIKFEQIFLKCLKDIANNNPETKKAACYKLRVLEGIFPWRVQPSIGKLVEAKKNSSFFFNETLANNINIEDPESLQVLIDTGFILLPLADENKSYPETFSDWLNNQASKLISNPDKNEKNIGQNMWSLEDALTRLICSCRYPYLLMPEEQRAKLMLKLMPNYIKLVELHSISLNSHQTIKHIKDFISDYIGDNKEPVEKLKKATINLFTVSCKNIVKQENLNFNITSFYTISPLLTPFEKDDESIQYTLAELTIQMLQDERGNEAMPHLLDSIIQEINYEELNSYLLLALASRCQEHIKDVVDKKIEAYHDSNNKTEQADLLYTLLNIFKFVNYFRDLKISKTDYIKPKNPQDKYFLDYISTPISDIFLSKLKSETVTVTVQHNIERSINTRNWQELNKHLRFLLQYNNTVNGDVLKIIEGRLKTETNPHIQEQLFGTVGLVLSAEASKVTGSPLLQEEFLKKLGITSNRFSSLDFLRQEVTKKQSFEGNRGIGRALVSGILPEKELEKVVTREDGIKASRFPYIEYYDFLTVILDEEFIRGEKSAEEILDKPIKPFSPLQSFILDLIKIIREDMNTARKFLPNSKFETKEEKEALLNLRNNSLIILAGISSGLSEIPSGSKFLKEQFEEIATKTLEDEFTKDPFVDMSSKVWAYDVTALLAQYDHSNTKDIESKLANLCLVLFLNNDSVFKCLRDNRICALMQENGISSFTIDSPDKKRKMEEIKREVTKELSETKQLIANVVLSSVPNGESQKYIRYLKILGYDEVEIKDTIRQIMDTSLKTELQEDQFTIQNED